MSKIKKRSYKQKFSDEEVYEQIKERLDQIRQRNLKQVQELQLIGQLYEKAKKQKEKRILLSNHENVLIHDVHGKDYSYYDAQEQGQQILKRKVRQNKGINQEQPVNKNLMNQIKQLILTKTRIAEIMTLKNCREILLGCYVRYQDIGNLDATRKYFVLARIMEIIEGGRQYIVNNIKLKYMLTLQESQSIKEITLSVPLIQDKIKQNETPQRDFNIQIQKWISNNKKSLPKQKNLKQKYEELQRIQINLSKPNHRSENLLLKCKKIKQVNETSEDINYLIDFLSEKIDVLNLDILNIKSFNSKLNCDDKVKIREQCLILLQNMKRIQQQYYKNKQIQKKADLYNKKRIFYNEEIKKIKRKDQIYEKNKVKSFLLKTAEGCKKIQVNLIENHMKYDLEMN